MYKNNQKHVFQIFEDVGVKPLLAGALKTTQLGSVDSSFSALCQLPPLRISLAHLRTSAAKPTYLLFSKPMAARNHIHYQPGSEPKT